MIIYSDGQTLLSSFWLQPGGPAVHSLSLATKSWTVVQYYITNKSGPITIGWISERNYLMAVVLFSVFHHFFLSFISFLISVSGCSRCVTCGLLSNFISFCVGMCTYAYLHVKKVLYFVCVPSNHLLKLQMCFSYTSDLIENSVLSLPSPDLLILSIPCTVRPLLPLLLSPPLLLY